MKEPFFSILLPTRNRSAILAGAIESVFAQSFQDFEIVLSDNDESPTATAEVAKKFTDPRLRYFRTSGNLPMHENWENALNQASGRHVLVLEDKVRMIPNALEILHSAIQKLGDVVISYKMSFAREASLPALKDLPQLERISAVEAVEKFCRMEQEFFEVLPKGLDSCAPMELVRRVKAESPTGLFFSWISPDYASGFMLLSRIAEFYRIEDPLIYIPNNWMIKGQYSNGLASFKITDSYRKFMDSLPVRREEIIEAVPVKTEFLWFNSVIYDFHKFYRRADHKPEISWVDYYALCKVAVIMGKRLGATMEVQRAAIDQAYGRLGAGFKSRVQVNFLRRIFGFAMQALKAYTR